MLPVVVLDSNLFVSALLKSESCRTIIGEWRRGTFLVVTSIALLEELREVLSRPKFARHFSRLDAEELLAFVESTARRVTPIVLRHPISRDKTDDRLFACAFATGAAAIVSGDADVLAAPSISGLRVMSPRQFLTWLSARP